MEATIPMRIMISVVFWKIKDSYIVKDRGTYLGPYDDVGGCGNHRKDGCFLFLVQQMCKGNRHNERRTDIFDEERYP